MVYSPPTASSHSVEVACVLRQKKKSRASKNASLLPFLHSIWLLIRSALATRAKHTSHQPPPTNYYCSSSFKFNEFCGQPSLHPHLTQHMMMIIIIYATRRAAVCCAFYPSPVATLAPLNKCMPIQFCTAHRFAEWTRFNYHYSGNYKFTELDSCNATRVRLWQMHFLGSISRGEMVIWRWSWKLLDWFMGPWRKLGGNNYKYDR